MRRPLSSPPTLLTLLSTLVVCTSCMCYNPNGTEVYNWGSDSVYQPCSNDTSDPLSNICCALNRDNPSGGSITDGFTADICMPSGLCQNILKDQSGNTIYSYWRDYCTDEEWAEGKCLSVCTGDGQHSDDGTAPLTPCGDTATATKWCCGTNNTDCCSSSNPNEEMSIPVSLGGAISSISATLSTSTATSSATSASTTSTSTSNPAGGIPSTSDSKQGLSSGAKAGIGVGAAVGAALIIGLGVFLALYAKRRKDASGNSNPYELPQTGYVEAPGGGAAPPGYSAVAGEHVYYAHHGQHGPSEVEGMGISEMGADGVKGDNVNQKQEEQKQAPIELA